MLSILLGILKFILFLIGLILIIIGLILFVPIKYNIIANSGDLFAKNKIFDVDIDCSWLLKILKLKIKLNNNSKSIKFFIFGIQLFKKKPKKESKKEPKKTNKQEENQEDQKQEQQAQEQQINENKKESTTSQNNNINNKNEKKSKKQSSKKSKTNKTKKSDKKKSEPKKSNREKFDDLKAKFDKYYNHPDRDIVITKTKELIIKLFKAILPKKAKIDIELGLDDPYILGQLVGYSAAFCGILNQDLFLHGNFDEKILKIDIFIRGKLIIWKVTYPLVRYALTKPIFKIIKNIIKRR